MRRSIVAVLLVLASTALAAGGAAVQDWPQWRGPNRDGVVPPDARPASWPAALKPGWKLAVGAGHASPVVAGRHAIVHTRQEEREVVTAVDLESGRIVWRHAYDAPYSMNPAARAHGKGPKSTPVVADGRVYTFGITEILSCIEVATGKLVWQKDFTKEYARTSPDFGTAMSPLVDRGLLIVHAGTTDQGALVAFDAGSGAVRWRWTGDGPGYASPIAVELAGTRQIVTQSQSRIVSVAADTGALLWSLPFATPYVQNIVTPVAFKDLLIFSGLDNGVIAVRPVKRGDAWTAEQVWKNTDVGMYMNSPVLVGNLVFGLSHKRRGQFFCVDAASGRTLWTDEGGRGDNAAMLLAGEFVVSLTSDADLIVSAATPGGLDTVRTYKVADSQTWAHPVLVRGGVLVKDATTLAFWALN